MKKLEKNFSNKVVAIKLSNENALLCQEAINAGPFVYGVTSSKEMVRIFFKQFPYFRLYKLIIKEPNIERAPNNLSSYERLVMKSANAFEIGSLLESLKKLNHKILSDENEETYHDIYATLSSTLNNYKFEIYVCGQILLLEEITFS